MGEWRSRGATVLVAAVVCAGPFACRGGNKDAAAQAGKGAAGSPGPAGSGGARVVPVMSAPVERRDVPIYLEGLGSVAAYKSVAVRSQVDGRLEKLFFREGQAVRTGDPIAQLDPRPFAIQLQQAEGAHARDSAQLRGLKLNLERYAELVKRKLIAQQQLDDQAAQVGQLEGAVRIDQAAIESARLNLAYAHIVAPIDGVTGIRQVDPGNLVRASDPTGIVIINQLNPISLLFTLPQDELPRIAPQLSRGELPVEAWSRDGQTRLGTGKLELIDNQINQTTATVRLKAIFDNPQHMLWPNQFVKARLRVTTRTDALVVPATAVQRGPEGTFVYVIQPDQTVLSRPVDIELTQGEIALVAKGLSAGEQVVVEGQGQLRSGARVQARPVPPQRSPLREAAGSAPPPGPPR
jgi:multidrug efflux system membrane fusion protein